MASVTPTFWRLTNIVVPSGEKTAPANSQLVGWEAKV